MISQIRVSCKIHSWLGKQGTKNKTQDSCHTHVFVSITHFYLFQSSCVSDLPNLDFYYLANLSHLLLILKLYLQLQPIHIMLSIILIIFSNFLLNFFSVPVIKEGIKKNLKQMNASLFLTALHK